MDQQALEYVQQNHEPDLARLYNQEKADDG